MNNCEKLQLILKIASIKKNSPYLLYSVHVQFFLYICLVLRKKERKKERSFSCYTIGFFTTAASTETKYIYYAS
jgi:hypothetical protein